MAGTRWIAMLAGVVAVVFSSAASAQEDWQGGRRRGGGEAPRGAGPGPAWADRLNPERLERLFNVLDADRNGQIDRRELSERLPDIVGRFRQEQPKPAGEGPGDLPGADEPRQRLNEMVERRVHEIVERQVDEILSHRLGELLDRHLPEMIERRMAERKGADLPERIAGAMRGAIRDEMRAGGRGPAPAQGRQWGRGSAPGASAFRAPGMGPCQLGLGLGPCQRGLARDELRAGRRGRPAPMRGRQWDRGSAPGASAFKAPGMGRRELGAGPRQRQRGLAPPAPGSGPGPGFGPAGRPPRQAFSQLDANQDGRLQAAELKRAVGMLQEILREADGREITPDKWERITKELRARPPGKRPPAKGDQARPKKPAGPKGRKQKDQPKP